MNTQTVSSLRKLKCKLKPRESKKKNFNKEGGSRWCLLPEVDLTVQEELLEPGDTQSRWRWWRLATPEAAAERRSSGGEQWTWRTTLAGTVGPDNPWLRLTKSHTMCHGTVPENQGPGQMSNSFSSPANWGGKISQHAQNSKPDTLEDTSEKQSSPKSPKY